MTMSLIYIFNRLITDHHSNYYELIKYTIKVKSWIPKQIQELKSTKVRITASSHSSQQLLWIKKIRNQRKTLNKKQIQKLKSTKFRIK